MFLANKHIHKGFYSNNCPSGHVAGGTKLNTLLRFSKFKWDKDIVAKKNKRS